MKRASLQRAGPVHASSSASANSLLQVQRLYAIPGCLPGTTVPGITYALTVARAAYPALVPADLDAPLAALLPDYPESLRSTPAEAPIGGRMAAAARAVLLRAGFAVPDEIFVRRATDGTQRLTLPAPVAPAQMDAVMIWCAQAVHGAAVGEGTEAFRAGLDRLLQVLARDAPKGINTARFLSAAHALEIPYRRLSGNAYQFGWGSAARRLDSSFTDATSQIATKLARNKWATAQVLRDAGLPVPDHALAEDEEAAVRIAGRLGYPVVVKPGDQDGGVGVSADLRTAGAVRKGFQLARAASPNVLVEKHCHGGDHRLQVFEGAVFWATHRVPGGVTGDGRRSVQALLDELNADPRRGPRGSNALLKQIDLDDEARELLAEHGLDPTAVPAAGRFVRLRRAANVASGGYPVPVLDEAHPDNLALAVRAARILGLDLAGVDLLIPDIRVSWFESGAAICEVNAQPQLSPHLPEFLLKSLLPGGGRIPAIVVAGACSDTQLAGLAGALRVFGRVGVATPAAASIDGMRVLQRPRDAFHAGWTLLCDRAVDAVLLHVPDVNSVAGGLPFDRFDVLVQADNPSTPLLGFLQRMCRRPAIPVPADPGELARIVSDRTQ